MNRDLLRPLVIALLAIVAIAVAGATLDTAVSPGSSDRDPGPADERDDGTWSPFFINVTDEPENGSGRPSSTLGLCIQILQNPAVVLGLLVLVVLSTLPVYRRAGVLGSLSVLLVVLPMGTLAYAFMTDCRQPESPPSALPFEFGQDNGTANVTVGNGTGNATGAEGFAPPLVLLAIGGLVVLALLATVLRSTGDDDFEDEESTPEPDEDALAAIGEAAGDAADRIDDAATVENEVYRAWREMTDLLDVANPAASTPGEFARAAADAGMDREHVEALTDVFREVRYGGAEVTEERERRAVDALRRIEDAYAGEGER